MFDRLQQSTHRVLRGYLDQFLKSIFFFKLGMSLRGTLTAQLSVTIEYRLTE